MDTGVAVGSIVGVGVGVCEIWLPGGSSGALTGPEGIAVGEGDGRGVAVAAGGEVGVGTGVAVGSASLRISPGSGVGTP